MIIQRAGTVSFFLWNKSTSLKWLKFHMHVSDDDSNKYVLQVWWNLMNFEKMLKFHDISRAGTVSIFLWKNITSLNWLKFHMHVSDDDSNKFCKFDEIWWTLKKCWNFMIFQRAGTVGILLWNKSTFLNWLKFHMYVSDDDSNMFCKFDAIRYIWKKCWIFMIFLGQALLTFFYEIR